MKRIEQLVEITRPVGSSSLALGLSLLLGSLLFGSNSSAQEFEIGGGINAIGPWPALMDRMAEHGFDDPSYDSYWPEPYPQTSGNKMALWVSYSAPVGRNGKLGVRVGLSNLRGAIGNVNSPENVFRERFIKIRLRSISVIPFYSYKPIRLLEFKAGVGVMVNVAAEKWDYYYRGDNYGWDNKTNIELMPGFLFGADLWLFNSRIVYGKLEASYLLSPRTVVGPFTTGAISEPVRMPESKVGFSHLTVGIILGFHLRADGPFREKQHTHIDFVRLTDVFRDSLAAEPYFDILRKVSPPLIDENNQYVGAREHKDALGLWIAMLVEKGIIERRNKRQFRSLLNRHFTGLDLPVDWRTRGVDRETRAIYNKPLRRLLTQID